MKILIIDDERPTLSMFKLFLTAYGYEVHTAENGEKGLEMFEAVCPDIVFTDIKMPGMDGLEVLRRIREKDTTSQVIIITGHGDMEKAVEALDLDASDFINKPVERQAINSALARAEKRIELKRETDFSIKADVDVGILRIHLTGKLTGGNITGLSDKIEALKPVGADEIRFLTDEGFSIDRSGISALVALIRTLKQDAGHITIENLSYSYCRVFQMAGLDRLAALVEDVLPE